MINVLEKRLCNFNGCNLRPSFNYENEKAGLYCFTHMIDGMINVYEKRLCLINNCKIRANYNFINETNGLYCKNHSKKGMIIVTQNTCQVENCIIRPCFNYPNETRGLYCTTHKKMDMIDVINDRCKANEQGIICPQTGTSKYNGYCTYCFANLFPNDPLTLQIRKKSKENLVRDYINSNFEGFQHDTPLWIGDCDCTHRRRIDHRKLIGNTLLCIETDEEQHKYYNRTDEESRYDDLMMLHGGKMIFIRFNPDKYREKNIIKNPFMKTRLKELSNEINKQTKRIEKEENEDLIEIIYMYYDS